MHKMTREHFVAFVLYPETNLLGVAGPLQVFALASELLAKREGIRKAYDVCLVSTTGGPIRTSSSVVLQTSPLANFSPSHFQTVLVGGGPGYLSAAEDDAICQWLISRRNCRFGAVCTGAFVLANVGLLNGRRAVTHRSFCEDLQRQYPEINVERNAVCVEDQNVWTSAGVTAGIDLALAMVERDWDKDLARAIARHLVISPELESGEQELDVGSRVTPADDDPIIRVMRQVVANPAMPMAIERLAEIAGMSLHHFNQAFLEVSGQTPAEFVQAVRLEYAQRLLEDTPDNVAIVSRRSGFGSPERMRRAFHRQLGLSPHEYRKRQTTYRLTCRDIMTSLEYVFAGSRRTKRLLA